MSYYEKSVPVLVLWCACGAKQVAKSCHTPIDLTMKRVCDECGREWILKGRLEEVERRKKESIKNE